MTFWKLFTKQDYRFVKKKENTQKKDKKGVLRT